MEITRCSAFWDIFLEVCFRAPGTSQKLLQKSGLRFTRLLSVLQEEGLQGQGAALQQPQQAIAEQQQQQPAVQQSHHYNCIFMIDTIDHLAAASETLQPPTEEAATYKSHEH